MSDDADLDVLQEAATNPAAAEVDGVVARQHSLREQIEFYRLKKEQGSRPNSTGFRISTFVPPGSV